MAVEGEAVGSPAEEGPRQDGQGHLPWWGYCPQGPLPLLLVTGHGRQASPVCPRRSGHGAVEEAGEAVLAWAAGAEGGGASGGQRSSLGSRSTPAPAPAVP